MKTVAYSQIFHRVNGALILDLSLNFDRQVYAYLTFNINTTLL